MGGGLWWGGKRDGIIGEAAIKFGDVGGRDGYSAGVPSFKPPSFHPPFPRQPFSISP